MLAFSCVISLCQAVIYCCMISHFVTIWLMSVWKLWGFRGSFITVTHLHTTKHVVYSKNKSVILTKWPFSTGIRERERQRQPLWCLFVYDIHKNIHASIRRAQTGSAAALQRQPWCSLVPETQTSEGVVKSEFWCVQKEPLFPSELFCCSALFHY